MTERRKGERRNWRSKPGYPLQDSTGVLVIGNRRRVVERRSRLQTAPAEQQTGHGRLRLYFHASVTELSAAAARTLILGRASGCDIEVSASHVSRQHARVEASASFFALMDGSTNGTYVRFDDGREMHLVKERLVLQGSGIISLGKPITEREPDLIYFLCA
jgi:hypothetical protein